MLNPSSYGFDSDAEGWQHFEEIGIADMAFTSTHSAYPDETERKTWTSRKGQMFSGNHPNFRKAVGDQGGPWFMEKEESLRTLASGTATNSLRGTSRGSIMIDGYSPLVSAARPVTVTMPSRSAMIGMGTTAIARTEPTNPAFSGATALGELRAGLPSAVGGEFFKQKVGKARASGSEYLNVEFGWKPLISDVKKLATAITDSDKILSDYAKGSGQKIRRRYVVSEEQNAGGGAVRCVLGPNPNSIVAPSAPGGVASWKTTKRIWFSGCYRYHFPGPGTQAGDKIRNLASSARKLYGIEITPEVLWNLSPWSWAADWFANTGDVMHNISAFGRDGLVMQYGYIMCETTSETVVTCQSQFGSLTRVDRVSRKVRYAASPYGFAVSWDGLSPKQLAIAGALGLSKTK